MADLSTGTEALYQKDGHLYTYTSTLTSISPLSSLPLDIQPLFKPPPPPPSPDSASASTSEPYIITSPSTIFHAQGGGQPSDTGTITLIGAKEGEKGEGEDKATFHVHQVRRVPPTILHMGTFSPAEPRFQGGEAIKQDVNIPSRVLNSRLHTAGHVIGLAINMLSQSGILAPNILDGKASHYPSAAFVEEIGLIPGTAKAAIQDKVDELVSQDLGVYIHFWSEEEAKQKCTGVIEGQPIKGDENGVRVVKIGDVGSYPCGGTHVKSLKDIGRVVVRNIKRQKGISKVSYEVVDV